VKPYWRNKEHELTIYCGDAREILPGLAVETCCVDPVWPNALPELAGADDPEHLFADICEALPKSVERLIVHLGCDSDPRFLQRVPERFPFFRVATLDYARPSYKGRLLYGFDVAYMFGPPPASRPGHHVVPGRVWHTDASTSKHRDKHPCERRFSHVAWLIDRFTEPRDRVVDPCCGSGTTLMGAWMHGRPCIGIEINEEFCEMAADRLEVDLAEGRLMEPSEVSDPKQCALEVLPACDGARA